MDAAVGNLLILLLEESCERRTVATAIGLSPDADPIIMRLVFGELAEPSLRKVPERSCRVLSAVCCRSLLLTSRRTNIESVVLLRHSVGPVGKVPSAVNLVEGTVCRHIVAETDLIWLINVQHVHVVVP